MQERDPKRGPKPSPTVTPQEPPGREEEMEPKADHGEGSYVGSGKLNGLVAVITGGDSGIGRAVAIAFAREGADVAIGYYSPKEEQDAAETCNWVEKAGRRPFAHQFDVSQKAQCKEFINRVHQRYGHIDILVNNAAYQLERNSILDIDEEQLISTFHVNILGYIYMVQTVLPHLKEGSVIINTGSVTALDGHPSLLDYSATKGAIHVLTKSLAANLAEQGIRVNCVAPGPVWTPLIPATLKVEHARSFGGETFWGRPAQPAEIAPSFVFFASMDSRYYTGEILAPTGRGSTR